MRSFLLVVTSLTVLTACDRDGRDFVPGPIEGFPGIAILNDGADIEPVPFDTWTTEANRLDSVIYHTLGTPESGYFGGATLTFMGTGGDVCVFVDPEAVWWNQSVSTQSPNEEYTFPDNFLDDGDIDIEVGLSAYYTGSPGIEMGTFEQPYEDSQGNQVTIEFNECLMVGSRSQVGAHAGRARPEYCTIDTSLHPDRQYTVVLRTWSIPKDDYLLSYGVVVVEGDCTDRGVLDPNNEADMECTIPGEARDMDGEIIQGNADLEAAFCAGTQNEYCAENPGMCG